MVLDSVLCFTSVDCDCSVWREAIQLSTSRPGKVDVVRFSWSGGACVGTGKMNTQLFHFFCFPPALVFMNSY